MEEKDKPKKDNKRESPINSTSIGFGASKVVQTRGEAASQILQAYSGKRYDSSGNELIHKGRNLKKISKYKVNPKYTKQNIKSQAGFSAELLEEANQNKQAILRGDSVRRRTTDGLGRINDTQYDLVSVDSVGNISDPMQLKFLGIDKKGRYSVIEKLAKDRSWDRYDSAVGIPSDQYQGAVDYANQKASELMEQAAVLREQGKFNIAAQREELAGKYKDAAKRITPTTVSEEDALLARVNPKKYVAKSIALDAHKAGVEAVKGGLLVGGTVSLVQNICAVHSGDLTPEEAAVNMAKTTVKAGATVYGVGSTGTALKALMHNSNSEIVRKLGTTNLPIMIVTSTMEIGGVVKGYISGEITETEALTRLGKSGTGSLAASYGAAVGTIFMPGIDTAVGSMVGYMVSSMLYDSCLQILVEADLAYDNYMRTKELCTAACAAMEQQRKEFETQVQDLISNRQVAIDNSLFAIMNSIDSSDTDSLSAALSNLADSFGRDLQFKTLNEFDDFMTNSSDSFKF